MPVDNSSVALNGTDATALQYNALRNDMMTGFIKPQYLTGGVYAIEGPSYNAPGIITVPSDATERYHIGQMIKLKQTTYKYFTISAITATTLTLISKTYTLTNAAITEYYVSTHDLPVGFPGYGGATPVGGIIMWSGSVATIPANWALCDGNNGTPDLRAKFVIGAGVDSGGDNLTSYNVASTGGANSNNLAHTHAAGTLATNDHGTIITSLISRLNRIISNPGDGYDTANAHTISGSVASSGSAAQENRPPYYALAFMMRVY